MMLKQLVFANAMLLTTTAANATEITVTPSIRHDTSCVTVVDSPPAPPEDTVTIPVHKTGTFYTFIRINNVPIWMLVDTGATAVGLTAADAEKIGIDLNNLRFTTTAVTSNGNAPRAPLLLREVEIGGILLRDIDARCCLGRSSLLGMSALRFLDVRITNGMMYLSRVK